MSDITLRIRVCFLNTSILLVDSTEKILAQDATPAPTPAPAPAPAPQPTPRDANTPADRDMHLFAVSASGSQPFSRQAMDMMRDIIVDKSGDKLKKDEVQALQTATTKDENGDITLALFRLENVSDERVENLTGDLALTATLDREIAAKLKGYSDVRTTFATETIPGTCFNKQKDGDEAAVDCGGSCLSCQPRSACKENVDCSSGICSKNVCQPLRSSASVATIAAAALSTVAVVFAMM